MNKIGIFFGTDSGGTRLIAKTIQKKLGNEISDKPININRVELADIMQYEALIFGTPTYGHGQLPGRPTGMQADSWAEILPVLAFENFTGKTIALFGLGDQEKYGQTFANSLIQIYDVLTKKGATVIGEWPTHGYKFAASESVKDGKFVGLVIDQTSQRLLTEDRIDQWLAKIKTPLLKCIQDNTEVLR